MEIPEFIRKKDFIACFSRFAKEFDIYGKDFRVALLDAIHNLRHEKHLYYKCHVHNLVDDVLCKLDLDMEDVSLLGVFWNEYSAVEFGYTRYTKVYVR